MPQTPVVDPSLYAFDPSKASQGAMQALEVLGTRDKLKAFREQQKEQQATRDARIAHIKAISDLAVLQANHEHAVEQAKTSAELAGYGLKGAQDKSGLEDMDSQRELAGLERQYKTKDVTSKLGSYDANKKLADDTEKAKISNELAQAKLYDAQAQKYLADAASSGKTVGPAEEAYLKKMGGLAAILGATPQDVIALTQSKALNEHGVPVSSELAALAELIQKPEFFFDPYDGAYGSKDGKKKRLSKASMDFLGGGADILGHNYPPTANEKEKLVEKETKGGAPVIEIDSDGNIKRPEGSKETPAQKKADKEASRGMSALEIAAATGSAGLGLASLDSVRGGLKSIGKSGGKMLSNALEGRSAAGRFTGKALKTLPKRSLASFASGGVASAAGPVSALYGANEAIGAGLSDKFTGDLTAIEGLAKAATTDSFDESLAQAKFDEIGQRINMIMSSGRLNDAQKQDELRKLVKQREQLRAAIGGG